MIVSIVKISSSTDLHINCNDVSTLVTDGVATYATVDKNNFGFLHKSHSFKIVSISATYCTAQYICGWIARLNIRLTTKFLLFF